MTDKDLFTGIVFTTNDMKKIAETVKGLEVMLQEYGSIDGPDLEGFLDFLKVKVEEAKIQTPIGRARGTE